MLRISWLNARKLKKRMQQEGTKHYRIKGKNHPCRMLYKKFQFESLSIYRLSWLFCQLYSAVSWRMMEYCVKSATTLSSRILSCLLFMTLFHLIQACVTSAVETELLSNLKIVGRNSDFCDSVFSYLFYLTD
jgi:hypothetical protein